MRIAMVSEHASPLAVRSDGPRPGPGTLGSVDAGGQNVHVHALAEALAALPERQRAAVALCRMEGLSNAAAAKALDVSVGGLEMLLVRARRSLRAALADLIEDER